MYIYIYIYIYTYIHTNVKKDVPSCYHHNGFVATHTLGHMMNCTSCAQMHELAQSHCGDNQEGTFFHNCICILLLFCSYLKTALSASFTAWPTYKTVYVRSLVLLLCFVLVHFYSQSGDLF